MFCSQCGKEITERANFCAECCAAVAGAGTMPSHYEEPDTGEPILILKPVFVGWVTALSVLPLQIFFTIWGAGFFGGFGLLAVKGLNLPLPPWFTFVFFGCLFFFGIPIAAYTSKKKTYAKTEYRFYKTKLEYYEGFFAVEEKTVDYKNIMEVYKYKGLIQQKYGLGTIILASPMLGYTRSSAHSGIRICDIENPDEVYEKVRELVNKAKQ
jgi:membrane protein YdbS with pleckstrin-like domain